MFVRPFQSIENGVKLFSVFVLDLLQMEAYVYGLADGNWYKDRSVYNERFPSPSSAESSDVHFRHFSDLWSLDP